MKQQKDNWVKILFSFAAPCKGKMALVDCGKQEELLKRCPLYADMWKAHIGAKNWSVSEKKEVAAHV